jgi:hypothetical protein
LPNFNANDGGRSDDGGPDGNAAGGAGGAGVDEERRDLRRSVTALLDAMQVEEILRLNNFWTKSFRTFFKTNFHPKYANKNESDSYGQNY